MSVENLKKEDLVGNSLDTLLREIDNLSKDGSKESYEKLEKFIEELAKISSDATLTVDKEGAQWMPVRDGKEIDLSVAIRELTTKIRDGINGNTAQTPEEQKARDSLREKIASTVGIILKEDEIVQELAQRGMTNEEFIRNAEEEIRRSQEKIASLEPLRTDKKETIELFGKTIYLQSSQSYAQKSKIDELKHDQQAVVLLSSVEDKLTQLQQLKDAMSAMDPNSPDYTTDRANNETAMQGIISDVKGIAGDLKALGLRTSPVGTSANRKVQDVDFTYLETLDMMSDFNAAKGQTEEIRSVGSTNKSIEALINEDYENIKDVMKANLDKFGFTDVTQVDYLSQADIDAKLDEIQKEFDKINAEIRFEEEYQAQTNASKDKFKEKADRLAELDAKFTPVRRTEPVMIPKMKPDGTPELDAHGNPVMIEKKIPKLKPDGTPELDSAGNPVMETEMRERTTYVPTADARKDYLAAQGITDEVAYRQTKIDEARTIVENDEAALSTKEKRDLIRASYQKPDEWHPLKWLKSQFFTKRMWNKEYKNNYLTGKISAAEATARNDADRELEAKISAVARKDSADRGYLSSEINRVREAYKTAILSAVSQEKITDELYRGQSETHVREGAKRAAMNTSSITVLEAEMLTANQRKARGEITQAEFDTIQRAYTDAMDARVMTDKKSIQDRAHADDVNKPETSRKPETPKYRDEER